MNYPQAISTVDVVLLTVILEKLHLVLMERHKEPFLNTLALPGGFVHVDTDKNSRDSAMRVLADKTGISAPYLEQLYTFSGPDRDPRGWSFSITYYALVAEEVLASRRTQGVQILPVDNLPVLAFDHNKIVEFALTRLRDKSEYSALPCYLLPAEFTLTELQKTYDIVLPKNRDKSSFRAKLDKLDFLEQVKGRFSRGRHRPAQLYRLRKDSDLAIFDRTV